MTIIVMKMIIMMMIMILVTVLAINLIVTIVTIPECKYSSSPMHLTIYLMG